VKEGGREKLKARERVDDMNVGGKGKDQSHNVLPEAATH